VKPTTRFYLILAAVYVIIIVARILSFPR